VRSLEVWLRRGPASPVTQDTHFVPIASSLHKVGGSGDFIVEDQRARVGDWVMVVPEGATGCIQALARVDRIALRGERRCAFSSLFWCLAGGGPELSGAMIGSIPRDRVISGVRLIRQVVAWFQAHYRIGRHLSRDARRSAPDGEHFCQRSVTKAPQGPRDHRLRAHRPRARRGGRGQECAMSMHLLSRRPAIHI
jgi:hypothetical protein